MSSGLEEAEIEALEDLKEDAKVVINHEIEWAKQSDQELMSLLRLNVAVLGIFGGAVYYIVNIFENATELYILITAALSILFWFVSIWIALSAYRGIKIQGGVPDTLDNNPVSAINGLSNGEELSVDLGEYYAETLTNHLEAISINARELEYRYALQAGAVYLLIIAMFVFVVGIGWSIGTIGYLKFLYPISIFIGSVTGILMSISLFVLNMRFQSKGDDNISEELWNLSVKITPIDIEQYDYEDPP